MDLVVSVAGDDDAERLVREFQGQGHHVVESVEQVANGRLATVRLQPPSAGGQGAFRGAWHLDPAPRSGTYNFNWGSYLNSLKKYCETGVGTPYQVDG